MSPEERKRELVAMVARVTEQRLSAQTRRHACCVAPGLGPGMLAKKLRADRLPDGPELSALAERLVDWALGLEPGAPRPFSAGDLETSG